MLAGQAVTEAQKCTHGADICRTCDRYWFHKGIADELTRLAGLGEPGYNITGIAGNLRLGRGDAEKYARQMIQWGELVEIAPRWDYVDLWVSLAESGEL